MIKFNFNMRAIQIDSNKFSRDLEQIVEDEIIRAIRAFLVAAIPKIPIFTGFARSAFRNLEDIGGRVGRRGEGFRITATRGGKPLRGSSAKKLLQPRKYYYQGVLKTTDSGRQFSTPPNSIITKLSRGTSVSFKFAVNIDYFDRLDREKWHSFQAGVDAFTASIQKSLRSKSKLPDIAKYITRKQVT